MRSFADGLLRRAMAVYVRGARALDAAIFIVYGSESSKSQQVIYCHP